MATTFLDIIFILFWPVVLSAAAWAIAIDALAETQKNPDVVDALTRPIGAQVHAKRADTTLRRRHLPETASGNNKWFKVQFSSNAHLARGLSRAKGRAKARALRSSGDRLRNRATATRRLRDNRHTETVSP